MSTKMSLIDGGKSSEEGAQRLLGLLFTSQGVIGSSDLAVTAAGTPDMTVKVALGDVIIDAGNFYYHGWITVIESVTITANSSGNPRIDVIVAYIDKSAVSTATSDNPGVLKTMAVAGTPAGSPVVPDDTAVQSAVGASNPFVRLAQVAVANGASSITNANITDVRTLAGTPSLTNVGTVQNILKNGNFINNSTNGYGATADDWTNSNANPIQGGFPSFTKQELIDLLGVTDAQIEGLWNLNGNFTDLSSNGYNLTASGSPTDTSDALMAQAKSFVAASSQKASATAANTLIAGSQTWSVLYRPTTIGAMQKIFGHSDSTDTVACGIAVLQDGTVTFDCRGLTTNTTVTSDVILQAGKLYLITAKYDGSNLSITINGIKKSVTATGSHTVTGTQTVAVGQWGSNNASYANGVIQNAFVLSVDLSDDQIKRLWAATTYKSTKVRRNGTDAYLYQDLPQDLVERFRGRILTLSAKMYQAVASTGQISIDDGTESATSTDTTTGSWLNKTVTKTISATATNIRIKIKHSTTNGNTWFKEVSLREGSQSLPFDHSKDDWARFPRLLQLNPPTIISAYQFEEKRTFSYNPTLGNVTEGNGVKTAIFTINGNKLSYSVTFTLGSTSAIGSGLTIDLAAVAASYAESGGSSAIIGEVWIEDSGITNFQGKVHKNASSNTIAVLSLTSITISAFGVANFAQAGSITGSIPMTWATGDTFNANGNFLMA